LIGVCDTLPLHYADGVRRIFLRDVVWPLKSSA